jgi:hypothetical protein
MHAHRGRSPGMTRARFLQRLIIAESLIQGVKIAALARKLGVSRSWASREANAPATRLLLTALMERHSEKFGQLLDQAFLTLEEAFAATQLIHGLDRQPFEVPDHHIRLEAAGLFLRLLATAAPYWYRSAERCGPSRCIPSQAAASMDQTQQPSFERARHKCRLETVRCLIRIFAKLLPHAAGPAHSTK